MLPPIGSFVRFGGPMRTYAPASPRSVLDDLLAEPSLARGVVHHEVIPAREAVHADWPAWLAPGIRDGLRARGIDRPYVHQAEAIDAVHAGRGRRRRHPDGVGQEPVLHRADPPGDRRRSLGPRAVPLPDQGARTGPGGGDLRARPGDRAGGGRRPPTTATRRRPSGRPSGRPGRSSSRTRTCSTRRSSPITRSGSSSSSSSGSSSSTSSTRTAASSGATSRTSCGGCSGCAPTTARDP